MKSITDNKLFQFIRTRNGILISGSGQFIVIQNLNNNLNTHRSIQLNEGESLFFNYQDFSQIIVDQQILHTRMLAFEQVNMKEIELLPNIPKNLSDFTIPQWTPLELALKQLNQSISKNISFQELVLNPLPMSILVFIIWNVLLTATLGYYFYKHYQLSKQINLEQRSNN